MKSGKNYNFTFTESESMSEVEQMRLLLRERTSHTLRLKVM